MFLPDSSLLGYLLVPRTADERLMVETKPLSSGCPSLREEVWSLCSDQREKKYAGKNTNLARFMELLPYVRPRAQSSTCFTA